MLHKDQQAAEAHLVQGAFEQWADRLSPGVCLMPPRHASHVWHGHTEEAVALAILARPGLEEAR